MADAWRDVAVCVDSSDEGEEAWRWTAAWLASCPCHGDSFLSIRLVHVAVAPAFDLMDSADTEEAPWLMSSARGDDAIRKAEEGRAVKEAHAHLADLLRREPAPEHARVTLIAPLAGGTVGVGEIIIATLAPDPPGLCVVGARGMGRIRRLLAGLADAVGVGGSVSDHVVHHAPFPVTVVKRATAKSE